MAIQTLNEIAHLKNSACGKPYPRHGLQLLYWFARDCVKFEDDQPFLRYNPRNGDFGFKNFHNKEDLLPNQYNPYYEVGNLNSDRASELPEYVQEHYDSEQDNTITNADRIIICLDNDQWLDRIYVTRHHGQMNFDQNHTYRISKCLLKIISNFSDPYQFLKEVGYVKKKNEAMICSVMVLEERTGMGSVQRPAASLHVTIPEASPPASTKRSRSSHRWNLCKCTIL